MPEAIISAESTEAPTVRSGRFTFKGLGKPDLNMVTLLKILRMLSFFTRGN